MGESGSFILKDYLNGFNLSVSFLLKKIYFDSTENETQGFIHARQVLYHSTISPALNFYFETKSCSVAQAGPEFVILLSQLPE